MVLRQTDDITPPCAAPSPLMNICVTQPLFSISHFIICIAVSQKSATKELQLTQVSAERNPSILQGTDCVQNQKAVNRKKG